jgi:DNA-binding MarR family transcriptional regulator
MESNEHPFGTNLYFSVGALNRAMSRLADEAFAAYALSPSHALVLLHVGETPDHPIGKLAETLFLDASTITRLIEKLEQKNLVTRRVDGRERRVSLTDAGRALLPELRRTWNSLQSAYSATLGEDHARVVAKLSFATLQKLTSP